MQELVKLSAKENPALLHLVSKPRFVFICVAPVLVLRFYFAGGSIFVVLFVALEYLTWGVFNNIKS